ncbi:hypothetical protein EVAR_52943_1 [Eumeta japonica]|uniref:Uncharacterized protein n=1 Tax=Eumeta variegata TaxID=151549 RepID=A0A4C1XTE2_EUMVA|nr:hypothetical protein EVAR_52943_1 [Eumeta japonica]
MDFTHEGFQGANEQPSHRRVDGHHCQWTPSTPGESLENLCPFKDSLLLKTPSLGIPLVNQNVGKKNRPGVKVMSSPR